MANQFIISDEHYNHEMLLAKRPFARTKEYRAAMIDRHNNIVAPEDTTYHLGDVYFGDNWKELRDILNKLNGTHILIIGNHDWLYIWNYIEAGFQSVHTSYQLEDYILVHDPAIAGVLTDRKFIHGHLHRAGLQIAPNCYNVAVEMHDYRPVNFEDIKRVF